jgi:hypothetical protein
MIVLAALEREEFYTWSRLLRGSNYDARVNLTGFCAPFTSLSVPQKIHQAAVLCAGDSRGNGARHG